jgi:hypothetical protein
MSIAIFETKVLNDAPASDGNYHCSISITVDHMFFMK